MWYDTQAYQTWAELESGVHSAATPIDADQTGVSMQLPTLFAPKEVVAMRPGGQAGGVSVVDTRLYPALAKDDKPVVIKLPGMRFAYEMQVYHDGADKPVYCYLGVLPKGGSSAAVAKGQILQAIQAVVPEASWEDNKTFADGATTADFLTVTSLQRFIAPAPTGELTTNGRLDLYIAKRDHATVLVGFRGPVVVAESVSLFTAGEAAVATIESKEPAKPIDASLDGPSTSPPAESYVTAPNSNVELVPPPGFEPSSRINGFLKEETTSQITIDPRATPYRATAGAYNANYYRDNKITENSREVLAVNNNEATLLLLTIGGQEYWTLVFGDENASFVVNAAIADPADKDPLRTALLTARTK